MDGGTPPYIQTGLKCVDDLLGGGLLHTGLYFLAARTNMGKTALALHIAEHVAKTQGAVTFISMEMSADQLTARRIAALANINSNQAMTKALSEQEYAKVATASQVIAKTPLYTTDGRGYSVAEIAEIARAHRGCRLVIVDHFGLIKIGRASCRERVCQLV